MMKNKIIIAALMLLATAGAQAQTVDDGEYPSTEEVSTVEMQQETTDTIVYQSASVITTKIKAMARAYGDSIVLRWVPEDYVSWRYLCATGVNILRQETDAETFSIDTLAIGLKPLTNEGFTRKYSRQDKNALIAQGVLYGEGRMGVGQTVNKPGSIGATTEYNGEQDISFAFAMLVAEWRPDLARDMAVGFLDRTAQPGKTYDYYIQPTKWETEGRLIFEPGVVERVQNVPYEPDLYLPRMVDSISTPRRLVLGWWDDEHSSYEIERRSLPNGSWQRLNDRPYVSMLEQPEGDSYCAFNDSVPAFGLYEYRIFAHDAFGKLTPSSIPHKVNVYDNEPPIAPQLKGIALEYPDNDLRGRTIAYFAWHKDEIEDDMEGYTVNYYNDRLTGGAWITLNDQMIPPRDSVFSVDVTNLRPGMVYVAAVDKSGNEGRSLTQLVSIRDYKAPSAPHNFRARVVPLEINAAAKKPDSRAYVILSWTPDSIDDDIMYYDVAFSNDTTHAFQRLNEKAINERMFLDSLALDVNQKYVYYKVRAVDYSTNEGEWTHWIEVKRPHITPPTEPHIDQSAHTDEQGMHMEWIVGTDADMDYHLLYRRCGEKGPWEVIGRYDADSLMAKDYRIIVDDNPAYDREQRYYYYVESFNSSPFTSKSLAISWLHKGPKVWQVGIELAGDYMAKEKKTRLVWSAAQLPFDAPYYWCIYRKGQGDDNYQFLLSQPADETEFTDELLNAGEQAEYYVMIQWRDGRQSTPSNTVTVKRAGNAQ